MSEGATPGVEDLLEAQDSKNELRFLTCGSANDGKSTLLDRLLCSSKSGVEDEQSARRAESRNRGTLGEAIDVAYRYFETDRRRFVAADAPGHEQYTREMVAGASTADVAVILVDARAGILTQTRRHSHIAALLGIRHFVLAVNKMDLVDYAHDAFDGIAAEFTEFAHGLGIEDVRCVPISALTGDNVFRALGAMSWYAGATLMDILETEEVHRDPAGGDFRLPVQSVNRSTSALPGFGGTIASGTVELGMPVVASLSGKSAEVKRILGPSGELERAGPGQSVTLSLSEELDVSRGDVIADAAKLPQVADQFAAHVIWMGEDPMLPERPYLARFAADTAIAQVTDLVHQVDVDSMDKLAAKTLELNQIGYCKVALDRPAAFDAYADCRRTGAFVLVDKFSNATVGLGVIDFALRRATNIEWREMKVDKSARARVNDQTACVLWFTGLSGSGKSTVADRLEQKLHALGKRTYLLDGDNVRHGLNKDLGFTDQDRVENIRRVGEVAKLMVDAGLIVLASFISPFRSERQMARALVKGDEFIEIFVDTPLETCERRDPKGLYRKARAGELKNFTGIDSDYERPRRAEIVLRAGEKDPDALADEVIAFLEKRGR